MTEDELESLREAARKRLAKSVAQQLRHMLESWRKA